MRRQAKKFAKGSPSDGSALILTVVLTSLLAMVGVLFVMMARVNQIATSGISESRELDSAIETVIAKISEELVLDVPGVAGAEYYDYPDVNNTWLASLEPYDKSGVGYCWRQISDITGYFPDPCVKDVPAVIIGEHDEITKSADADGDGVADSKWIELDDITSSKGKPIYAAIRIIDNGGMINVDTAYKFDPNETNRNLIDGSSQTQINLFALSERGATNTIEQLDDARYGDEPHNLNDYIRDVVWHYDRPDGNYTPFDISDELELRNRFLLEFEHIDTRIEKEVWTSAFTGKYYLHVPVGSGSATLDDWFGKAQYDLSEPNAPNDYSYRHIATIYNMDRIIRPDGGKMVNINRINDINDVNSLLYPALLNGLDPCLVDVDKIAAQIAVNLKDYRDGDSDVTSFIDVDGTTYYGFERPCVYISELAHKFVEDAADPSIIYRSYAIELHKPYSQDDDPNGWRLVIDGALPITIGNWTGGEQFCVIRNEDSDAPLPAIDPGAAVQDGVLAFDGGDVIELQRRVGDVNGVYIVVDSIRVPDPNGGWLAIDGIAHSIQRDITLHKCIRRLWSPPQGGQTLGSGNNFQYAESPDVYIQAHPSNEAFTNVGEIGMLFRKDVYSRNWSSTDTDEEVRIDLTDPHYQNLFRYITVFDPASDGIDNDGDETLDEFHSPPVAGDELKVPGRININTAPWFVIAQLPWMQYQDSNSIPFERAKAISDKRDEPAQQGFWSIGELMLVDEMPLGADGFDQVGFPDLTTPGGFLGDGAIDDFEERDLIFARISNLVTVRSDVFTAYILVRIGTDGPQKRVIAILDRSDVYLPTDRVKIVAVHPVADPR